MTEPPSPAGRRDGAEPSHGVSFAQACRVWLRISLLTFGGPAGQIAVMHRILVDELRWISESRFLHALNYCMLLPGPEAQQLATYIGWLMHRTRGGLVAGGLFILPGAIALMVLSWIYAAFGQVGPVAALFFGLKAAVLAIVVQAVVRVGGRALKSPLLRAIAALSFVALFCFNVPFPVIILAAMLTGWLGHRSGLPAFQIASPHAAARADDRASLLGEDLPRHTRPSLAIAVRTAAIWLPLWLAPVVALVLLLGSGQIYSQIAVFFSHMAVVTFGGAYAVLAYVAQEAVGTFGWLKPGEMLDGLGMAETTPGPLIMVLQFVGFMAAFREPGLLPPLLAGTLGGLLTTWVTFAPCFLWIFLGGPYVEALRANRALGAALATVTAAVVGVILNLAVWFAVHTMFRQVAPVRALGFHLDIPVLSSIDGAAVALAVAAAVALFRFKIGMLPILAASAAAGVLLHLAGGVT